MEDQATIPIKDHAELSYSGENGRPGFQDLIEKLATVAYYDESKIALARLSFKPTF